MDKHEVENMILGVLHEAYFTPEPEVDLSTYRERTGWDEKSFNRLLEEMAYYARIKHIGIRSGYCMEAHHVDWFEDEWKGSNDVLVRNKIIRIHILEFLAKLFEEEGADATVHYQEMAADLGLDAGVVWTNLKVLEIQGSVWNMGLDGPEFSIHPMGLKRLEIRNKFLSRISEFEKLQELSPQPRGREFQKFLAKVLEQSGWSQLEGVRNIGEEIDIIIHRDREFYMLECKWEKDPVEAIVIRDFHDKLLERAGVQGIVVSMSGFSEGAEKIAHDRSGSKLIAFFGQRDVQAIVYGQVNFDDLLKQKIVEIVTHRKVTYS